MNYARTSLHPRVSTFSTSGHSGGPVNHVSVAQACVVQAEQCSDQLKNSLAELESGTKEMHRLAKILQNTRLYVLLDEPSLRQIKSEVVDAIEPQIEKLIAQGEKAIANLEKTSASLQKKADVLNTRAGAQAAGDQHAGAPLHVRNEIRKVKLLSKQEKTLEQELASLQEEIDDLELQVLTISNTRTRPPARKPTTTLTRKK